MTNTKAQARAKAAEMAARSIRKRGAVAESSMVRILVAMIMQARPVMADEFHRATRGGLRKLEKLGLIEYHADGWHLSK